jgi:hypothetical protein
MKSFNEFLKENTNVPHPTTIRKLDDFEESQDVIKGKTADKFLESLREFFEVLGWKSEIKTSPWFKSNKVRQKDASFSSGIYHVDMEITDELINLEIDLPTNEKIAGVSQHSVYRKSFYDTDQISDNIFDRAAKYLNPFLLAGGLTREYYDIKNDPERRGELLSKRSGIV